MGRRFLRGLWRRAAGSLVVAGGWWLVAGIASGYQLFAIAACLWHLRHRGASPRLRNPAVSILKPVRGADPDFYQAIRSQALQDHPQFEILFGIRDAGDPAAPEIQRLIQEFPSVVMRLILCSEEAPNGKVGVLMDLAREARHPLLIVSDSDITVPPGYLKDVTAPLADPAIGLVTCLYRAEADDWPSRFEALAIATDFAPSTLVAPFVGVSEFGLGSTLAFRRADLDRIGGFASIANYLADDYQLGRKLHSLGLRNLISKVVVSTRLSAESWRAASKHQLRWARTIRLSRGGGYAGFPVTFATLWAVARGRLRIVVGRRGAAGDPICHGDDMRLVRPRQRRRLEILVSHPSARLMGSRDLGGRPVRRHCGMARPPIAIGRRGKNYSRG